jgi:hypothetical protein
MLANRVLPCGRIIFLSPRFQSPTRPVEPCNTRAWMNESGRDTRPPGADFNLLKLFNISFLQHVFNCIIAKILGC